MSKYVVNSRRMFEIKKSDSYVEDVTYADGIEFEGHDDDAVYVIRCKRQFGYTIDVMFKAEDVVDYVKKLKKNDFKDNDIDISVFGASDCKGCVAGEWGIAARWYINEQVKVEVFTKDREYLEYIRYIQNNLTAIHDSNVEYCGVEFVDPITFEVTSRLIENAENIDFSDINIYRYFEIGKSGILSAVEGYKGYYIDEDDVRDIELEYIAWITFYGMIPDNLDFYIKTLEQLVDNEQVRNNKYDKHWKESMNEESENEDSENEDSENEESDNEESENEESDNEESDNEESDNEESDNEESENEESNNEESENEESADADEYVWDTDDEYDWDISD